MTNTFGIDIIPDNDLQRIKALKRYQILDTPPEGAFDDVAKLATQIFKVPISLISLVDEEQVYFKANIGMGKAKVTTRGVSLCSLAVLKQEVTVFEDAPKEPCLLVNPNVAGSFGLKFYAGAPLTTHDGFRIGTLCVIDKTPRKFTKDDEVILEGLAKVVMDEIELRLAAITETDNLQQTNEELSASIEELASTNNELATSRESLSVMIEQLSESEAKLRAIFEKAPSGMATLKGRDLIIESVNEQILEIWGNKEEITGLPLDVGVPRLKGTTFLKILDEVFVSGETHYGYEAKVSLERNGVITDRFYDFIYQPLKDPDGQTHAIVVVAIDITEQRNTRKAVDETNQRLNIALDAGEFGSTEVDLSTGKMDSTPQFKKCYGRLHDEEFTYSDLFEAMQPEYREEIKRRVSIAKETHSIYEAEYPISWPDGSIHWISAHGRARYDDDGNANRMVGVVSDITERKEYERHKDDFLGMISHELKTPITTLKANLQLLDRIKTESVNPIMPRLVDSSNKSIEKINTLVDDLLDMHRVGEGQLRLQKTDFTVWDMLHLCCNHVRVAGNHELIIEGDKNLIIHADEHRIDQVIVNFVNNAVKYAPDSKNIHLIITREGDFAKIAVKDFGPGILAEQLPHLFERYWRADYSSKKYSGLGLGLYICSEIIKRHDGEIGADSELGKGSTFWFTIPLTNPSQ